jgi:lipopolysaccharide assembly outer membrane protein LptD (OstA)
MDMEGEYFALSGRYYSDVDAENYSDINYDYHLDLRHSSKAKWYLYIDMKYHGKTYRIYQHEARQ